MVRYALFAVRNAYAPSIPVSDAACNTPELLSVLLPPTWHVAQLRLKTTDPRAAAATSNEPAGGAGALMLCWYARSAGNLAVTTSGVCRTLIPRRGSEKLPRPWHLRYGDIGVPVRHWSLRREGLVLHGREAVRRPPSEN